MKVVVQGVAVLAVALLAPAGTPATVPGPFQLGSRGCAMAHCDPTMSDLVRLPPPTAGAEQLWHEALQGPDGLPLGGQDGLGCAANGSIVACTFGRSPSGYPKLPCEPDAVGAVAVYGYGGNGGLPDRLWTSSGLLNCTAWMSAPLVGAGGGIIVADDSTVVRFGPQAGVLWQTATVGGIPISPVITQNGVVVLATLGGPISAYHNQNGALVGSLDLTLDDGRFETSNTPAVRGNRVYVVTQLSTSLGRGRLVAIDVALPPGYDPENPPADPGPVLTEAWHLDVGGPGGASPLLVGDTIYFDGNRLEPGGAYDPHIFAVRDRGTFGEIVWVRAMPGRIRASFALDPRGGFWTYTMDAPPDSDNRFLFRLALNDSDGDGIGTVVDRIDVDALVGEAGMHRPRSALSVAGPASDPVLLVAATRYEPEVALSTAVLAISLTTKSLLWKIPIGQHMVSSQFPIVNGPDGPRAFFVTRDDGAYAIGAPPAAAASRDPRR